MAARTLQLQIRVTPREKALLRRLASAAGLDVSAYVLARALPDESDRFSLLLRALRSDADRRYALAEINDFLTGCAPLEFAGAVADADVSALPPWLQNYVAAMVELAADAKQVAPPAWVREIEPLDRPHFATSLESLLPHLLRSAPVPFKRRNIFVDSSLGARV